MKYHTRFLSVLKYLHVYLHWNEHGMFIDISEWVNLPIGGKYMTLTWGTDLHPLSKFGLCWIVWPLSLILTTLLVIIWIHVHTYMSAYTFCFTYLFILYPSTSRDTIIEYMMLKHGLAKTENSTYMRKNVM